METAIRRLTRSRRDRVFGGVCGGLAEYLMWDPAVVRVAYVVLTLLSFGVGGVFLYLIAWMFIPLTDQSADSNAPVEVAEKSVRNTRAVVGVLLCIAGALMLMVLILPFWVVPMAKRVLGPLLLIVLGLALVMWRRTDSETIWTPPVPGAPRPEPGDAGRPQAAAGRHFVRVHQGRKIAGVCAGFGRYFDLDPTIIRLLWLVFMLLGGAGILLYLICWVAMPLES
jgi:phage shock protein C